MRLLFKRFWRGVSSFFLQQLSPGWYADYANHRLDEILDEDRQKQVTGLSEILDKDAFDRLKADFNKQSDRKKNMEDKAKSILSTISISITAITFSMNNRDIFPKEFNCSTLFLILSIMNFVMATIRAIQALNLRAFYTYETIICRTEGAIEYYASDPKEDFRDLVRFKVFNDSILSKIANSSYAAYVLVRNGIIFFCSFFFCHLIYEWLRTS